MPSSRNSRFRVRLGIALGFTMLWSVVAVAQLIPPPQAGGPGDHGNNYIVMFRDGSEPSQRAAAAGRAGARVRFNYSIITAIAVTVPSENALAVLRSDPSVLKILPDYPVYAIPEGREDGPSAQRKPGGGGGSGSDTVPAGVARVGAPTSATVGAGIGVAIVDTGVDLNHTDLAPVTDLFSAYGGSCQDDNGHGTHVAGTVAARWNSSGLVGVAPGAALNCVKVLDASGSGSDSAVIAGLEAVGNAAVSPAIKVVNMSLGRAASSDDSAMRAAVQALYNAGIVVVASAGNSQYREVKDMVPAGFPEAFAVASTTAVNGANRCSRFSGVIEQDTASYFTTDGKFLSGVGVTISGPGEEKEDINPGCLISSVGILSTRLGGGTTRMSGTSMAAPHVTGAVVRYMLNGYPTSDGNSIEVLRTQVRNTAAAKGSAPKDSPTSSYTFDGEREGVVQAP